MSKVAYIESRNHQFAHVAELDDRFIRVLDPNSLSLYESCELGFRHTKAMADFPAGSDVSTFNELCAEVLCARVEQLAGMAPCQEQDAIIAFSQQCRVSVSPDDYRMTRPGSLMGILTGVYRRALLSCPEDPLKSLAVPGSLVNRLSNPEIKDDSRIRETIYQASRAFASARRHELLLRELGIDILSNELSDIPSILSVLDTSVVADLSVARNAVWDWKWCDPQLEPAVYHREKAFDVA